MVRQSRLDDFFNFSRKIKDPEPEHLGPFWHRKTNTFRPQWKRDAKP